MAALTATLGALACGIVISACGGSSPNTIAANNGLLAASECMRAHGVPNFPDPSRGPGGSQGMTTLITPNRSAVTVQGISFSGPAFEAASQTCGFMRGGAGGPPQLSESYRLATLQFARCMRAHGVPNYPDPSFPDAVGVQSVNGPAINRTAPAVRRAADACNQPSGVRSVP